ncbi:MAG: Ig-like domain-containing protein, partial [Candidatus Sericytochromatia bacterium]
MKKLSMAFLAAAIAATASGCIVEVAPVPPVGMSANAGATMGSGRAPIIQALDYSPKSMVGKNDAITFTIVANDVEGDVLQYNWASTKGLLSANSGQVVSWKAAKADGSFEPGLTTVTVIISDGRSTTTGSVNIMIDAQGQATVNGTATAPAATAAPSAA